MSDEPGPVQATIADTLAEATNLLNTYTPVEVGALIGKDRKAFTDLASELAECNEGAIGTGHRDEDGHSAT